MRLALDVLEVGAVPEQCQLHVLPRRFFVPLLGRSIQGYLEKGIQTPMAQGRSTKNISMMNWIWTSRLSVKNSLSTPERQGGVAFMFESVADFLWVSGFRVQPCDCIRASRLPESDEEDSVDCLKI